MLSYIVGVIKYLPLLFGIGIIIFLHELGHFLAARIAKVDVEVLSFGYGPKLFSIRGKKSEFRISCIPFGGYCRLKGSLDLIKALKDESKSIVISEAGSYFSTTPLTRFFIYLAGPLMNFLLAAILITIAGLIPVERLSDEAYITPIANYQNLFPNAPMQDSIEAGDKAIKSEDYYFHDYQELVDFLTRKEGEEVQLTIERGGALYDIILFPLEYNGTFTFGITNLQAPIIGRSESSAFIVGDRIISANGKAIDSTLDLYNLDTKDLYLSIERNGAIIGEHIDDGHLPFAWHSSLRKYNAINGNLLTYGIKRAWKLLISTLDTLGAILTFQIDDARSVITGPMKAATKFGQISTIAFNTSKESGTSTILYLLAIVSISICVGNILPIPTFDGGQMLINVFEMVKRKPLNPKSYITLQAVGMIIGWLIIIGMYAFDIRNLFFS